MANESSPEAPHGLKRTRTSLSPSLDGVHAEPVLYVPERKRRCGDGHPTLNPDLSSSGPGAKTDSSVPAAPAGDADEKMADASKELEDGELPPEPRKKSQTQTQKQSRDGFAEWCAARVTTLPPHGIAVELLRPLHTFSFANPPLTRTERLLCAGKHRAEAAVLWHEIIGLEWRLSKVNPLFGAHRVTEELLTLMRRVGEIRARIWAHRAMAEMHERA